MAAAQLRSWQTLGLGRSTVAAKTTRTRWTVTTRFLRSQGSEPLPTRVTAAPLASSPAPLRPPRISPTRLLRNGMQGRVEQESAAELRLVPRFLARHRLQARRKRFLPLPGERGHIPEDAGHLLDTEIAGIGNRVEPCAAHG